ncbi:hypothetical protein [Methylomonas albis]|nr:hypothetical protein [Methylomonas albis]
MGLANQNIEFGLTRINLDSLIVVVVVLGLVMMGAGFFGPITSAIFASTYSFCGLFVSPIAPACQNPLACGK